MIPNILLCHKTSPMNLGLFYRYGFMQAGCHVRVMGPIEPTVYGHDFPADDWERPHFPIESTEPMDVAAAVEIATNAGFKPDAVVMADQFDAWHLVGESPVPWAWLAVENWEPQQLARYGQRRGAVEFHSIRHTKDHNTPIPEDSEFLPFAFDQQIHPLLNLPRDKVAVQIGTHYQPRPQVWNGLRAALDNAPAVSDSEYGNGLIESERTLFGKVFSYRGLAEVYNRGLITISASNCDFLPMRVFEAWGMGCILVSDDQPILRKWLGPPSEPPNLGLWFAHDGTVDGIVQTVMDVSRIPDEHKLMVIEKAYATACARHTYRHRASRVLERLGLQGATRMVTD